MKTQTTTQEKFQKAVDRAVEHVGAEDIAGQIDARSAAAYAIGYFAAENGIDIEPLA